MNSEHKRTYINKNGKITYRCTSSIRQQAKKEIEWQLEDSASEYEYDYDEEAYCSYATNPCYNCRANYLKKALDVDYLDQFEEQKAAMVEKVLYLSMSCIWEQNFKPGLPTYTITFDGAEITDVKALIDFYTDDSISLTEWMLHHDEGIRELASVKYARR